MSDRATSEASLKARLNHVLWIGGATDAGKTTAATRLSEKYALQTYHFDRPLQARAKRVLNPEMEARVIEWREMSEDDRWLRSSEVVMQHTLDTFLESFHAVVLDLLSLPGNQTIIAEGFGFVPELIAPLLAKKQQAIWLVPAEAFKRKSFDERIRRGNKGAFTESSDPQAVRKALFDRDMLLGEYIKKDAQARGLSLLEIDGGLSPEQVVAQLEIQFAEWLKN